MALLFASSFCCLPLVMLPVRLQAQSKIDEVLGLLNKVRTQPQLFLDNRLTPYIV
ncbi:MAG: hypothetical protein ACKODM_05460 [Cytophagales bacterium]